MATATIARLEEIEASLARYDSRLERLEELELALVAKDREIEQLRAGRGDSAQTSRRNLLKGGAITAGAAIAGSLAVPKQAAADDGDPLVLGQNNEAQTETLVETKGAGLQGGGNIFTVSDNSGGSFYPSAIGGYAYGDEVTNGVYAFSNAREDSSTITGHAIVSWRGAGGRSNMWMRAFGTAPPTDTYEHRRGECVVDNTGTFWFCVGDGMPGTWRKIAGPTTSGAMHAIAPARVYDSRFTNDPIATGADRTISVADSIDPLTGALSIANVVPENATAVFFNLTITRTVDAGFLVVAPGGTTTATASTINWSSAGATIANGSMSTLDDSRQVAVLAGGGGTTDFIVDITGYAL